MRMRFAPVPKDWESAQVLLDELVRSLSIVLDRGVQVREQIREVRDVSFNTDDLPISLTIEARVRPVAVHLLSAIVEASSDAKVISGGSVTWEWRDGTIRLHAFSALSASTKYNAVIAILE